MSNVVFPTLPGLKWGIRKETEFFNLTQKAAAPGFRTALSLGPDPIFHFTADYSYLREYTATNEVKKLEGFFNARRGDWDSFLLDLSKLTGNPKDATITGQVLTFDTNKLAPLIVTREGYNENIYELNGDPVIKMGGVTQVKNTNYSIQGPGVAAAGVTYPGLVIHFLSTITGTITADFSWYYRCRFSQSSQEFSLFSYLLWECASVEMETTRN